VVEELPAQLLKETVVERERNARRKSLLILGRTIVTTMKKVDTLSIGK
jgi:hypothetical protein